ncbi:hypothetical protein BUALT_Bualt17G0044700 [Buddleja alternifolia]|uniref:AIPP2-like SPOC-like domain-containing protein n=1 Tax=Buddleja alternifolia TaxID=168488 RepID=A0AAV6WFD8_9LAMI|nr:hypothetical protein BUALT_Bualt17G0044700 [Buddleja alternifolia]
MEKISPQCGDIGQEKRGYKFPDENISIKKLTKTNETTEKKPDENFMYTIVGCDDKEESDDLPKTHSPSDESHHDRHVYAEPLIRSIWGGRFNVYTGATYTTMEGFSAFVSSKACKKVYEEAVQFPPMKYEGVYDTLVFDMITGDLVLRAFLGKAELLIFTSLDLPLPISRFQGKIYLWGALRGKM